MLYEVLFNSQAYAVEDWINKGVRPDPWNVTLARVERPSSSLHLQCFLRLLFPPSWQAPTEVTLPSGASATYGVRLRLAPSVDEVPSALVAGGIPVATPLPAATLNVDMNASIELLLPALPSSGHLVLANVSVLPPSALAFSIGQPRAVHCGANGGDDPRLGCRGSTAQHKAQTLSLTLHEAVGRCRLTLHYVPTGCKGDCGGARGVTQTVHLMLLEPATELLRRFGVFSSHEAWLPANASDPWHRSPAFMGSDAELPSGHVASAALVDEPRVFMSGLSDEAGAAAPLAMAVKQLGAPVTSGAAKR